MVQRLLLLTRPGLVATHWSGLSMESLLDLGMSLPSTVGHNDHEMPPKHGQICGYEGALLTGSWPLPAASTKIKSWPLKDADLQRPLQRSSGWRQKIRHSVLWEKPGKTGLQIVRCFQVKIFMSPNSCIFPYLEKYYCQESMSGPGLSMFPGYPLSSFPISVNLWAKYL